MTDLVHLDNIPPRQSDGLLNQLDENIIERLPKRNTSQGLSENTKQAYLSAIRDFNRFLAANSLHVSRESLKLYFDEIKSRLKASTLNLRRTALMKVIKALVGENDLSKHIAIEKAFQQINSYKVDKSVPSDEVMTEDEIRLLIKSAQSEKTRLLVHFIYKSACRVSEMCGIRLTDCRTINGYVKLRLIGKGSKERDVAIPKELYEAIKREYGGKTWLFESKTGKPLHPDNVANQIRKAARRAGFDNWQSCTPHKLRHSRSTDLLLRKGLSLKAVSKVLGHQSVSTTAQMYIHDSVDYHELFAMDSI